MPPKGDLASVPINLAGRKLAAAWDPAKDEAAGEQCKAYGAAEVMRMPTRLHVTWQDDNTLKLETDAGSQTRIFRFGPRQGTGEDWQGISSASWDSLGLRSLLVLAELTWIHAASPSGGSLKVVTTKLKPGYLRKNGGPHGAGTVLTEYIESNTSSRWQNRPRLTWNCRIIPPRTTLRNAWPSFATASPERRDCLARSDAGQAEVGNGSRFPMALT
jgi:hypothetical protein